MNIEIGKTVRELRRRDGRTQEDLAQALGVSPQAVSRWEQGGAYPDMELIPSIANYFGVSIDELFGYENDRDKKVDALLKKSEELHRVDMGEDVGIDECIALLRDGLIEFPGNERIMLRLAVVLRDAGYVRDGQHSLWDSDGYFAQDVERHRKNGYWKEAIKLLEKLSETASRELIYDVRFELLLLYDLTGEYEKAAVLANTFPIMQVSRQASLTLASSGSKRAENSGKYLLELFDELVNRMVTSTHLCKKNFDDTTALETVQNAIKLSEQFFIDGNYGHFHGTLVTFYLYLSSLQFRAGFKDETFDSLYKALDHAKAFQSLADKQDEHYTASYLRQVPYGPINYNRDSFTLAEDWPWWFVPDPDDIESEIKSDPRWKQWVKACRES